MKWLRQIFDASLIVAGIIFLTVEVWRDRSKDYHLSMGDESDVLAGPPLPNEDDLYEEYPMMYPIFSTRPALRMVN